MKSINEIRCSWMEERYLTWPLSTNSRKFMPTNIVETTVLCHDYMQLLYWSENWFILSRCLLLRNNASKSLRTWKKNKSIAHDTVKFDIAQCTIMLYALNIHVLLHVIGMNKKDEQTKLWNPWQSIPRGSDVWLVFINIIGP